MTNTRIKQRVHTTRTKKTKKGHKTYNVAHIGDGSGWIAVALRAANQREERVSEESRSTPLARVPDRVIGAVEADAGHRVARVGVEITETADATGKLAPELRISGIASGTPATVQAHSVTRTRALLHVVHAFQRLVGEFVGRRVGRKGEGGVVETERSRSDGTTLKKRKKRKTSLKFSCLKSQPGTFQVKYPRLSL